MSIDSLKSKLIAKKMTNTDIIMPEMAMASVLSFCLNMWYANRMITKWLMFLQQ